jgi:tellurite resistance protein
MDEAFLFRTVLGSVLRGRSRKRTGRAMRYLTRRHSIWADPTTLLTAAGVAWGIYETMKSPGGSGSGSGSGLGSGSGSGLGSGSGPVPPLPGAGVAVPAGVSQDALRLVRLAISAANADGVMGRQEHEGVIREARAAGVGDIVEAELQQRRPLAEIVAGVTDDRERATLYVLAFTILRADEQVTGAERIYLAQLANLLGLDPAAVERLEKETAGRIDAAEDGSRGSLVAE